MLLPSFCFVAVLFGRVLFMAMHGAKDETPATAGVFLTPFNEGREPRLDATRWTQPL